MSGGYCSVEDVRARASEGVLAKKKDAFGKTQEDTKRIETAIVDAKEIVHQILPYLGKGEYVASGEERAVLKVISIDIAMYRMVDGVQGSEDARKRYEDAIVLLKEIGDKNQRGLRGVNLHGCEAINVAKEERGTRFQKGQLL